MQPPPKNWPRISSALFYRDPMKAIDWLCNAFAFEVQIKVEADDGSIQHSELRYGEGLIMVSGERDGNKKSPKTLKGSSQSLCIYVDDVEAHFKRAREHGGKIIREPETQDYGEEYWTDRGYEVEDLEGHRFYFVQRMREQK